MEAESEDPGPLSTLETGLIFCGLVMSIMIMEELKVAQEVRHAEGQPVS